MFMAAHRDTTAFDPLNGHPAFFCRVFPGFLSPQACRTLIALSESRGFQPASRDYPPSYRDNDRQVVDDPVLAARLLDRLRPHVPQTLPAEPGAPDRAWTLSAINERLRFCRYRPGQRFQLHQDGVHHRGEDLRSHLTFMVYLTDGEDFGGGDTIFYSHGPGPDAQGQPAREIARVRPRAGSLILFDHRLWHAGDTVRWGVKHIMRSDVLYQRPPGQSLEDSPFSPGHQGYVWTMARLADGSVASGGRDATVRRWRADGRALAVLRGHRQSVLGLAALEDGRLASVSRDRSLRLWREDRCEQVVQAHDAAALCVGTLPGGLLATGGADGAVKLWTDMGQALRTLRGHHGWVWSVMPGPSPGLAASASEDGSVRLWDIDSGQCREVLPGPAPLRSALILPGTHQVLTGDIEGRMTLWSDQGGPWRVAHAWPAHGAAIRRLRLLGHAVASAGEDRLVRLWRLGQGPHQCLSEKTVGHFATDVLDLGEGRHLVCAYDGGITPITA